MPILVYKAIIPIVEHFQKSGNFLEQECVTVL